MLQKVNEDQPKDSNARYRNMTITYFMDLALFEQELHSSQDDQHGDEFTVIYHAPSSEQTKTIEIPLRPETNHLESVDIVLHQSPTRAFDMGDPFNAWFSSCLGYEVRLVYLGPNLRPVLGNLSPNAVDQRGATGKTWLSTIAQRLPLVGTSSAEDTNGLTFADVAPYLVVTEEALADVSSRLPEGEEMDMTKFRPNIVLSESVAAYDEDFWRGLRITSSNVRGQGNEQQAVNIVLTQNCARCVSLNVDYHTGEPAVGESGTILKKMMKDRRVDKGAKYSPIFGRYGFLEAEPQHPTSIAVGDIVEVTQRNTERTKFGKSTA
ncbi:hypothetical protein MMC24_007212 [Lignoscripta atroalba]|nr:hypothetical protein [Lignoscripta atroalba]